MDHKGQYGASFSQELFKMVTNDRNVSDFEAGLDLDYAHYFRWNRPINKPLRVFSIFLLLDGKGALRIVGGMLTMGVILTNTFCELVLPRNDAADRWPIHHEQQVHI